MRFSLFLLFCCLSLAASGQVSRQTAKPWTYWWWMGSAVEQDELRRELQSFADSGLGGVHIIPIYGAKGYEEKFLPFLGEEWMQAVQFTIRTADSLGLGVDLTLGTGWPFGGPWVTPEHAAKRLVATDSSFSVAVTGQQVKRAAPGGEGPVMDYFSGPAVDHYLAHFDSVFAHTDHPITPRAFYHDSYEVYGADWTPGLPGAFAVQHGYPLEDSWHLLRDTLDPRRPAFIHDLRATLGELLYTEFADRWVKFSHAQGQLTRLQAHGSPGNILDLYGLADIPETESFGCSEFGIPGLACDPDYSEKSFGRPSALMMKFASSPAHLMGKPLVSSETATWLGNHFKVALRQIKPQVDQLFVAGINHVFYHGSTYSPTAAGYPGWRFYASTNFNATSHFYDELPLLNRYITACQERLQEAAPDNDGLLYFPLHDLWSKRAEPLAIFLDVHHYADWFGATAFGRAARELEDNGFAFDYVSDRQLAELKAGADGEVYHADQPDARYRTIVVPPVDYIPEQTMMELRRLAGQGVAIVFQEHLPRQYAGLENRDKPLPSGMPEGVTVASDLSRTLEKIGARREMLKSAGLDFIRKQTAGGQLYFVTNLGAETNADSLGLAADYRYVVITDPLTGRTGYIPTRDSFALEVVPGSSYFIETAYDRPDVPVWQRHAVTDTVKLDAGWTVTFLPGRSGAPRQTFRRDTLDSWTAWGNDTLASFSGKAVYRTTFALADLPAAGQGYRLQFDRIHESAQVTLNGVPQGAIWSYPNQLDLNPADLRAENELVVTVQNVSANYLRQLDQENPGWKNFYDINFVDITYRPFAAANWPLQPSGLMGEARLLYLR